MSDEPHIWISELFAIFSQSTLEFAVRVDGWTADLGSAVANPICGGIANCSVTGSDRDISLVGTVIFQMPEEPRFEKPTLCLCAMGQLVSALGDRAALHCLLAKECAAKCAKQTVA